MPTKKPSIRRVVMAKAIAERWISGHVNPEYRVSVHLFGQEGKRIPSVLRGFRDGKVRIGSVDPIRDLGVSESFDSVDIWSTNREGLRSLVAWFDAHGYETSGVW